MLAKDMQRRDKTMLTNQARKQLASLDLHLQQISLRVTYPEGKWPHVDVIDDAGLLPKCWISAMSSPAHPRLSACMSTKLPHGCILRRPGIFCR